MGVWVRDPSRREKPLAPSHSEPLLQSRAAQPVDKPEGDGRRGMGRQGSGKPGDRLEGDGRWGDRPAKGQTRGGRAGGGGAGRGTGPTERATVGRTQALQKALQGTEDLKDLKDLKILSQRQEI